MDDALGEAARALAAFDPLGALQRIALRDDPPALALRGVAMAQLGEFTTSRRLLGRAARAFERSDRGAHARCLAAQGEVALASRDLRAAGEALDAAVRELEGQGDRINALFARLQCVRRLVLVGALDEATTALAALDLRQAPPRLRALAELVGTDIAIRSVKATKARQSLSRARAAARAARLPSLASEIERTSRELDAPVARLVHAGSERLVALDEVERLLHAKDLVIDACRREVRAGGVTVPLVTRPVLFSLAVALGSVSPNEAARERLAQEAFGVRRTNDSVRVRLRVEMGRLRAALSRIATVEATAHGYALHPRRGDRPLVLLPPAPGETSAILALLRGGEAWSTSALATAIGSSQRTVQRALASLRDTSRAEVHGRGRAQRWVAKPPEGFATTLLLVSRLPAM